MKWNEKAKANGAARQAVAAGTALTRGQVADQLGTSVASVRRLEGKTLHPTKGADGVNRFDAAEVQALAADPTSSSPAKLRRSADGDLAAEAFIRFSKGLSPREVVIELRQPPEVIQALHRQWRESGGLWLPAALVTEFRKEVTFRFDDLRGLRIRTAPDLVDALDRVLAEVDDNRDLVEKQYAEIVDLKSRRQSLRDKLERCRAELADWEEWAAAQEKKTTPPEQPPAPLPSQSAC